MNTDMNFKDLSNYTSKGLDSIHNTNTKEILDMAFDNSIDQESLRSIRKALQFDEEIDLIRLAKDHKSYVDSLKQPKVVKIPKATTDVIESSPVGGRQSGLARYREILRQLKEANRPRGVVSGGRREIASKLLKMNGDPFSRDDVREAVRRIAKGVREVKKAPRTLSQGLKNYNKVLRTIRELYPYSYRDAQRLASTTYRSGINPNSEIEIIKAIQQADEQRFADIQAEFNR